MTSTLQNVSDTAFWVAYYRALEGDRTDALFKDPLAKVLMGERAQQIAESMPKTAAHTQQNVLMRTLIIDRFIQKLIHEEQIDTLINLGAGLDTRPYRLELPKDFRWIEIDYANLMELKNDKLSGHSPTCQLERHALDLSDQKLRQALFVKLAGESKKTVILTEGVLPYLTETEVSSLSDDLRLHANFAYWIADYVSPAVYKYLRNEKRMEKMKNTPFRFFPTDYLTFFQSHHWELEQMNFIQEEAEKHGRELPPPTWVTLLPAFVRDKMKKEFLQSSGYLILKRGN
jgi:methyltransferase (TIGR00027 family)